MSGPAPPAKARARTRRRTRNSSLPSTPARSRAPSALRRWIVRALVFVPLAFGVGLATILVWAVLRGPGDASRVVVRFNGDETRAEAANRLAALGLVSNERLLALYLALTPGLRIDPGAHVLRRDLSPRALVQRLGRLASRPTARITFPEGYTFADLAARLEDKEICVATEFVAKVEDPALLSELGIRAPSAEGFLFPATYDLRVDSNPAQVVRQFVAETRRRLARIDARNGGALARLAASRNWGELEVLTLASIVEREAAARDERALVASVFLNRLDDPSFRPARMLQSDPTAAYGCRFFATRAPSCATFNGKVTPDLLRDAQNPYNTYRHPGLPPGPIGNPGEAALEAVLKPAQSNYLYFVADGHGRHRFSRSFDEHRRAITH